MCNCTKGWTGPTCDQPVCPAACTAHGTCVQPGSCACASGWTGPDCSVYSSRLASLGRWVTAHSNSVFAVAATLGTVVCVAYGAFCNLWQRRPAAGAALLGGGSLARGAAGPTGVHKKRVQFCPVPDTIPPSPVFRYAYPRPHGEDYTDDDEHLYAGEGVYDGEDGDASGDALLLSLSQHDELSDDEVVGAAAGAVTRGDSQGEDSDSDVDGPPSVTFEGVRNPDGHLRIDTRRGAGQPPR